MTREAVELYTGGNADRFMPSLPEDILTLKTLEYPEHDTF